MRRPSNSIDRREDCAPMKPAWPGPKLPNVIASKDKHVRPGRMADGRE
jgi:hypothetical protein